MDAGSADGTLRQQRRAEGERGRERQARRSPALEMHSDVGLFIIMTPAEYFSVIIGRGDSAEQGESGGRVTVMREVSEQGNEGGTPFDSGLRLALPSGQVVRPQFPPGCLLIMNGEGSSLWMRAARGAPRPYAPPHEVLLPSAMAAGGSVAATATAGPLPNAVVSAASAFFPKGPAEAAVGAEAGGAGYDAPSGHRIDFNNGEVVRAWFGRMFFPPRDAVLQQRQRGGSGPADGGAAPLTFGEYRQQTYSAFHEGQPQSALTAGKGAGWGGGSVGGDGGRQEG